VKLDSSGLLSEESWVAGSDISVPACVAPRAMADPEAETRRR
jgi:hypothetical protein